MSDVEFRKDGHVAYVRLNRPSGLNAITAEMDQLLFDAWKIINQDNDIWVAVLSAEGEKGFCIGGDVSGGTDRDGRMALGGGLTGIAGPLVMLTKPLIASVQGFCERWIRARHVRRHHRCVRYGSVRPSRNQGRHHG